MVNDYLKLSYISYEGARFAASLPGLAVHPSIPESEVTAANKVKEVQGRVLEMLEQSNLMSSEASVEVHHISEDQLSSLNLPASVEEEALDNSVIVSVSAKFSGYFLLFRNIPLKYSTTVPYLFRE